MVDPDHYYTVCSQTPDGAFKESEPIATFEAAYDVAYALREANPGMLFIEVLEWDVTWEAPATVLLFDDVSNE